MELFAGVNPDPTDQNVREKLAAFKMTNSQAVVDLGVGSSLGLRKNDLRYGGK